MLQNLGNLGGLFVAGAGHINCFYVCTILLNSILHRSLCLSIIMNSKALFCFCFSSFLFFLVFLVGRGACKAKMHVRHLGWEQVLP